MTETKSVQKPLPRVRGVDTPYWEATARGEFRLQRCSDCGTWRFPPSEVCPACLSEAYSWDEVSGRATLWSWVIFHQIYFKGFADEIPYAVAFVELEEGPYMVTNVVESHIDSLAVGTPLEVVLERAQGEYVLPRFRVVQATAA